MKDCEATCDVTSVAHTHDACSRVIIEQHLSTACLMQAANLCGTNSNSLLLFCSNESDDFFIYFSFIARRIHLDADHVMRPHGIRSHLIPLLLLWQQQKEKERNQP